MDTEMVGLFRESKSSRKTHNYGIIISNGPLGIMDSNGTKKQATLSLDALSHLMGETGMFKF